VNGRERFQEIT